MVDAHHETDRSLPDWRTMKKGPDGKWVDGIRVIDGETFLYVGDGQWWRWAGFCEQEKNDEQP